MAKLTLSKPTSGFNLAAINDNFTKIEAEFQNKVLYRANPTGETNTVTNDIDMNSNDLLNVGSINGIDASGLNDLSTSVQVAVDAAEAASISEDNAAISESNASASANSAASSAAQASIYSSLGLGGASAFDLGTVTDTVVIFPTDWGTVI